MSGIEVRKNCVKYIKKNLKKVEIHNEIKEINKKFDTITLFHVLEHLPHQVKILKNIKSKLKKKGKIIVEVPHANDFLLKYLQSNEFKNFTFNSSHLILHTSSSLKKIMQKSGFKDVKISYFQRYNFANTLYWLLFKKPGGHEHFKHFSNKDLDIQFSKFLIKNKITDTIIATAKI